jgi:hypothetical protein
MPVWNSETVAELNAAGLGIDLRPSDILALR